MIHYHFVFLSIGVKIKEEFVRIKRISDQIAKMGKLIFVQSLKEKEMVIACPKTSESI